MNQVKMYAVKDIKSEMFSTPHFLSSDGVAIRSFSQACEDPQTDLNKFPSDFSLYHIGLFNVETGFIEPVQPKQIANASEFVQKVSQEALSQFARDTEKILDQADH